MLTELPLAEGVTLRVDEFWPLENPGIYLQHVQANYKDENKIFSVYLTIDPQGFSATAFHDIHGRIYQLKLSGHKVTWDVEEAMANKLQPEYILADFFVTNLPLDKLQKSLKSGNASDTTQNNSRIRCITKGGKIIRKITFSNLCGSLWKDVKIENPEYDYSLVIKTVDLQ